jgi:hypothetical protein
MVANSVYCNTCYDTFPFTEEALVLILRRSDSSQHISAQNIFSSILIVASHLCLGLSFSHVTLMLQNSNHLIIDRKQTREEPLIVEKHFVFMHVNYIHEQ